MTRTLGRRRAGRPDEMTASSRVWAYLALGAAGLLAGLLLGRIEPVVLAAPFVAVLTLGLLTAHRTELTVDFALDRERAIEGDEIVGILTVASDVPVER